jgi:hypothetical protein
MAHRDGTLRVRGPKNIPGGGPPAPFGGPPAPFGGPIGLRPPGGENEALFVKACVNVIVAEFPARSVANVGDEQFRVA